MFFFVDVLRIDKEIIKPSTCFHYTLRCSHCITITITTTMFTTTTIIIDDN